MFLNRCSQIDTWLTKICEQMWSNGWTADKNFWTMRSNGWATEESIFERMNNCRKLLFLSRCGQSVWRPKKIITTILGQVPLQLYKHEWLDHFLIWYCVEIHSFKNKANLFPLRRNINHDVCTCLLLFCVKKTTLCHATISTMCNATDM